MKSVVAICTAIAAISSPAIAQTGGLAGQDVGLMSPTFVNQWSGSHETPSLAAHKLRLALALKAEAEELLVQDGGTFTKAHERYVRRKAARILGE